MKKLFSQKSFNIICILISAGVLISFSISNNGITGLVQSFVNMNYSWLLFGVACIMGYWFLDAVSLHVIIVDLYPKYGFLRTLKLQMLGLFYNAITPFASGGQPFQVYIMSKNGMEGGKAASIITFKAILFHIAMGVFAVASVFFGFGIYGKMVPNFFIVAIAALLINVVIITALVIVSVNEKLTDKLLYWLVKVAYVFKLTRAPKKMYTKLSAKLTEFHKSAVGFMDSRGMIIKSFIYCIIELFLYFFASYCVYRALNLHEYAFYVLMVGQVFVLLIASFVPLPGGSGGAEGSFYLFFNNVYGGAVMPGMLIWRILSYYSVILVGAVMLLLTGEKIKPQPLEYDDEEKEYAENND